MAEGSGGGGQDSGRRSKPASVCESAGDRVRFRVDLRPVETTIVSWKKLLKGANLTEPGGPGTSVSGQAKEAERRAIPLPPPPQSPSKAPPSPSKAPPSPSKAPTSSKHALGNDAMDAQVQPGSNRLSNVIERIERMYAGNGSSDDEADVLDNVPDDDEYDTNDSFIDDTELDDYFQVDNSAIKHDGFFVNRGKLERIEPIVPKDQQLKKRRRKDLTKSHGEDDEGRTPNKIVKTGNKGKKASSSLEIPLGVAIADTTGEHAQYQIAPADGSEVLLKKKSVDAKIPVAPSGVQSGDANRQDKNPDRQVPGILSSAEHSTSKPSNTPSQRSNDKSTDKKEGSSARSKSTVLDKAIRELEKIVAESRPPSTEAQDPDNLSLAVKRRLPPEIKQKLAKVARLAQQASCGTIPKDVINRLMSIVGHLMQVRTLKRNLKVMANMGVSAKQDKDDRVQKIKHEIAEMVKQRIACIKQKTLQIEQHPANTEGLSVDGPEEKNAVKRKYNMDDVLENKICELYDLYIEGLQDESGSPVKRLYQELITLWPSGFMDSSGIKRAVYRAKERRGVISMGKHGERIKKKKPLPPKAEDPVKSPQSIHTQDKKVVPSESRDRGLSVSSRPDAISLFRTRAPGSSVDIPKADKMNPEKTKGSSTSNPVDSLPKKTMKKKPNADVLEAQSRLEKLVVSQVEERPKRPKQTAVHISKPNSQPGGRSL